MPIDKYRIAYCSACKIQFVSKNNLRTCAACTMPPEVIEAGKSSADAIQEVLNKRPRIGHIYLGLSNGLYKIGITTRIKERFDSYSTSNPYGFKVILFVASKNYKEKEKQILSLYSANRLRRSEWMNLEKEDIAKIQKIMESK